MDFLTVEWNELVRNKLPPEYIMVDHSGYVIHTIYSRTCVHVFILGYTRHVLGYPSSRQQKCFPLNDY